MESGRGFAVSETKFLEMSAVLIISNDTFDSITFI